jgi:hypothetical protein
MSEPNLLRKIMDAPGVSPEKKGEVLVKIAHLYIVEANAIMESYLAKALPLIDELEELERERKARREARSRQVIPLKRN